jgi:hypothetical protein
VAAVRFRPAGLADTTGARKGAIMAAARTRTTRTAKAQAETPAVDLAALLADPTVLAALAALRGTAPADTQEDDGDDDSGVESTGAYTPPPGQPTLTAPDGPASLKVKRLWADLRLREIPKPTKAQTDAMAAYEQALNRLLLSVGVKGAATVTAADAQWAVHELSEAAKARKAARKR